MDTRFDYDANKLKSSDFSTYPHKVYATAFLVDGKLADYRIGCWQRHWGNRTFRGSSWENEIIKNKKLELTCEYNEITVKDNDEHNNAFDILEKWLDESFSKYNPAGLKIIHDDLGNYISMLNRI